jgi:hypothetical protein
MMGEHDDVEHAETARTCSRLLVGEGGMSRKYVDTVVREARDEPVRLSSSLLHST